MPRDRAQNAAGRPLQEDRERLPSDRRTRHRLERLDRVYDAAIELFIEKGYDATTMEEIAERADVARASVFNYFDRKTALLDEWTARRRRRIAEILAAEHLEADSIELTLTRWFAVISAENENRRAESVALMTGCVNNLNLIADHPLGRLLGSYLTAAKRKGEIRRNVDPERAGMLLAVGYFNVFDSWIKADPPFDMYKELMKLLDLIFDGILATDAKGTGSRSRRVRAPRRATAEG